MSQEERRDDALMAEAITTLPVIARRFHITMCQLPEMVNQSPAQLKMLSLLCSTQEVRDAKSTIGDIAQSLGISMPAASEMIDRLVDEGFVERAVNPADRRQVLVRLTGAAEAKCQAMRRLREAQVQQVFARLTPDEQTAFVQGLRALTRVLELDANEVTAATAAPPPVRSS